ncbi:MAG: STAS domain-containing protein [Deltaproteobacteria bacterium]|jgi:HptB-dependent secretion and biofilm anti anti-sigma factor|nr:STAS domain-containing protein [Deltaproteobacteria bacterium]
MAVKAQISEDGKILTISVPSRLDITAHKEFGEAYKDKLGPVSDCIVDMADVEFLDSSALGMLLMFREKAAEESVDISIANCSSSVKKIFEMANFDKLFKME